MSFFFLAAGACLSWGLPSNSCRSLSLQDSIYGPLTQVLATLAVLAEASLTQASVQTPSQTLLWMDDKTSSPWLKTAWGIHRSRHSKSIDSTSHILSFIHSDTFILKGTYLSLFKCLVRLTTQRIHRFFKPIYTHNDCISSSAILSNNFVSLLYDL